MKNYIITVMGLFSILSLVAQENNGESYPKTSLKYSSLGSLFSEDTNSGSSRYNAMSGAFGALGGDISATNINPATAAVLLDSKLSFTLNNNTKKTTKSNFLGYENSKNADESDKNNFSNAGAVLTFNNSKDNEWRRTALYFNYQLKRNFRDKIKAESFGKHTPVFTENPNDKASNYSIADSNVFEKKTTGEASVFNLGLSAFHKNNIFIGGGINFHSFNFSEMNKIIEDNIAEDNKDKKLNAFNIQDVYLEGNGVSISGGTIYKLNKNIRLGLAFETPVWFTKIYEESNTQEQYTKGSTKVDLGNEDIYFVGETIINSTDSKEYLTENDIFTNTYKFKTPSRLTTSAAYLFSNKGLISIDYTVKDLSTMRFKGSDIVSESNEDINNNFGTSHEVNIGSEWLLDRFSLRGGFYTAKIPTNTVKNTRNGFSTGLGYKFNSFSLDIAYTNRSFNNVLNVYRTNGLITSKRVSNLSATITF